MSPRKPLEENQWYIFESGRHHGPRAPQKSSGRQAPAGEEGGGKEGGVGNMKIYRCRVKTDTRSGRRRQPKNLQGCPRGRATPLRGKKRAGMRPPKREHGQGYGRIPKGTLASPIPATPPCNGLQPQTARMNVPPRVPLDGRGSSQGCRGRTMA